MQLKIKNKLYLSFGLLSVSIALLWIFSSFNIFSLTNSSEAMIKDNYNTVVSCKYMALALDEIKNLQTKKLFNPQNNIDDSLYTEKCKVFEKNLVDEEHNITEAGEKDAVIQLRSSYERYLELFKVIEKNKMLNSQTYFTDFYPSYSEVRNLISLVSDINLNAIINKNEQLKSSSHKTFIYISVLGGICFIISISVFLSFPVRISRPIQALKTGIKEIAEKNYSHQLKLDGGNIEFQEVAESFNRMASKLLEYNNSNLSQILFEKKRAETIINKIKDAVIVLNERKEIILMNSIACEIIGVKHTDILGKYAPDIASQNDLLQNIIKDLMNENYKTNESNLLKIYADGKESYFSKDILDIKFEKPNHENSIFIGQVIMLKNITKFQELNEAKTNFIATISHELKTPISSIKLNLKLLEDIRVGDLNEEQHSIVKSIKEGISRLQNISGELLDLTQIETGNIQLTNQLVKPSEIINYAVTAIQVQAEQANIPIEINCEDSLPFVNADPDKTAWVIVNMLSNALRYSPENGKIVLEAIEQNNSVVFSVRDFGKGIEKKYQDKIFYRFFQIPGNNKSGSGLGLAISKEFIEAQGGKVWVESKLGEGSKFCFTLKT